MTPPRRILECRNRGGEKPPLTVSVEHYVGGSISGSRERILRPHATFAQDSGVRPN